MTPDVPIIRAAVVGLFISLLPQLGQAQLTGWLGDLEKRIEIARAEAYPLPKVVDISAYSDASLWKLEQRMRETPDPCVAAVEMALFLDSRRFETSYSANMEGIEAPWVMALEIVATWVVPDGVGVGTSVLDDLLATGKKVFSPIARFDDALDTWEIAQRHFVGSIERESGGWAYDAWREAQDKGWTEEEIVARARALAEQSAAPLEAVHAAKESLETEMMRVDLAHGDARLKIEARHEAAIEKIRTEAGGNALRLEEPAFAIKLANAKVAFTNEWGAELARYEDAQRKVIAAHGTRINNALMSVAKLQVQRQALQRYARPVADNDCEGIGKPPEPALKSGGTPLEAIIALPHDRLLRVLKVLGVSTSPEFLNCLCRLAEYGKSGTQQFYHPDTWGTYDKRYSCQHPGDACIVAGYGCLRHPLPSDSEIWERCAVAAVSDGGVPLTKAITDAVAERARRKTASQGAAPKP
ncbi:MAG: hypothetical protein Q8P60_15780 [Pseudorhodobacter sp.]|nr:hypothetical protein [Pseudorhodobacter sp.]